MEDNFPTIVVVTYNRINSVKRLLLSLCNSYYPSRNVRLVISIDGGAPSDLTNFVENFKWKYGDLKIIKHTSNLGLRNHIISCGDLVQEYENLIVLEDDLYVSPYFYEFASKALAFYCKDDKIAGISLYNFAFNEYTNTPFIPLFNGKSTYFMQVPSSWGQAWSKKQWTRFKDFYDMNPEISTDDKLPDCVKSWSQASWKKYFYKYIVDYDLYFVYPYISYSTNFSDAGVHHKHKSNMLQVALANFKQEYCFASLAFDAVIYDAYFDPLPSFFAEKYLPQSLCVDLNGLKQLELFTESDWLTIKNNTSCEEGYGFDLLPIENNVLLNNAGTQISFVHKQHILPEIDGDKYNLLTTHYHSISFNRGYNAAEEIKEKYYEEKLLYRWSNKIYNLYSKVKNKYEKVLEHF